MNNVIEYIQEITGQKINLERVSKKEVKNIPIYILNDYTIWKGKLFGKTIFFLEKISPGHFTPLQYEKQMGLLEKKLQNPIVFVLPEIKSYDRNRLIRRRINFIIGNKQIFIPHLLVDLKEYRVKPLQSTFLQPAAQVIVLYHLQRQSLNEMTYKQIAGLLQYPYLTISRAVENLLLLEICKTEGKKEKKVIFKTDKKELWEKALPLMRTPVKKKVFINQNLPNNMVFKTNINALAFYTDMNDDGHKYYAVNHQDFLNLKKEKKIKTISNYDGDYVIELWRYNPGKLTVNNYVDPLSLYLCYKDTADEREEMALEQLLESVKW
ncbi:hypothetical protein LA303_09035 [Candidatus Sulfidibacterium hydrothermale]|uniref:hypothetical protein n=1 Tax=Candidatus Sulfidibacterium hydrothermale TaxID=2875962 RepID=UPI001F0A69EF|nr:hypothetical protein [Candidatus Sulfidibacterium hydrothermale]UBM61558.1 hypothetical protein LA303_09035 [Candidatus Sulfidibacterium hydrothermale]